jgi:quercetin dioxygenase-like cupin family protein
MHLTKVWLIACFAMLYANASSALAKEKTVLNRAILLEQAVDLPSSAITAKVMRVLLPPAFKTPWHTHPGPGPRYVVKGQLKVTESGKTQTYSAGEVFWETGTLMAVENIGKSEAELIIFEMAAGK